MFINAIYVKNKSSNYYNIQQLPKKKQTVLTGHRKREDGTNRLVFSCKLAG